MPGFAFLRATADTDRRVEPLLARLLAKADVPLPSQGERLTEAQIDQLLKDQGTHERFRIKAKLHAAGLTPAHWRL